MKKYKSENKTNLETQLKQNFITMTYCGKVKNSIHKILEQLGHKIVYTTTNNISELLKEAKPTPSNKFNSIGVY